MRALVSWLLTMQLLVSPVAAQLGEKEPGFGDGVSGLLSQELALQHARAFSELVEIEVSKLKSLGALAYVKTAEHLSSEDRAYWQALAAQLRGEAVPRFNQTAPGEWSLTVSGKTVALKLLDLYRHEISVNGAQVSTSGSRLRDLEPRLRAALRASAAGASMFPLLLRQLSIGEAYAEPVSGTIILLIASVVGVILTGSAWYYLKSKPRAVVEALGQVTGALESDAGKCEQARSDADAYNATFDLATKISERTRLNSLTTAERAVQLVVKEQLDAATRTVTDCYDAVFEAGKHLGFDVPRVSASEVARLELLGARRNLAGQLDVRGAVFQLCGAHNRLTGCMQSFVAAHIDDSSMSAFKETARRSFYRYQQQSAAGQR